MSERKLKAAIVGCGGIAHVHAAVLDEQDTAELIAFADIKPERARALAEKYGGNAYSSLEEMLENEKPDVLHVCTPHYLHVPMIEEGVKRGMAVFSEKPPVIDYPQWERLRAAAEAGRVGICFQNRYNPETKLMEELISSGELGDIIGGRAFVTWRREAPYYTESGWRGALATEGGGVLINQSIHTMDLLCRFMGRADSVDASMTNHHLKGVIEVEDVFEANISFGGKPGVFFATTANAADSPVLIDIIGSKASARIEEHEVTVRRSDGSRERRELPPLPPVGGKEYWGAGHGLCIGDFYDSLLAGRPYMNDIPGVTDTAELMLAAYRSAREGVTVKLG